MKIDVKCISLNIVVEATSHV